MLVTVCWVEVNSTIKTRNQKLIVTQLRHQRSAHGLWIARWCTSTRPHAIGHRGIPCAERQRLRNLADFFSHGLQLTGPAEAAALAFARQVHQLGTLHRPQQGPRLPVNAQGVRFSSLGRAVSGRVLMRVKSCPKGAKPSV